MVYKTALGCPSGRSPPYPRIKHCRAGKANLSIFILRLLTSGMSLVESPSFYLISFCHRISKKKKTIALSWLHIQPGCVGGGGGGLRISSDKDDRMGAKIKTPQNPKGFKQNAEKYLDQNFTPQKSHPEFSSQNNLFAELRGRDTWELSLIFRLF